jgi:hypothetical protein
MKVINFLPSITSMQTLIDSQPLINREPKVHSLFVQKMYGKVLEMSRVGMSA